VLQALRVAANGLRRCCQFDLESLRGHVRTSCLATVSEQHQKQKDESTPGFPAFTTQEPHRCTRGSCVPVPAWKSVTNLPIYAGTTSVPPWCTSQRMQQRRHAFPSSYRRERVRCTRWRCLRWRPRQTRSAGVQMRGPLGSVSHSGSARARYFSSDQRAPGANG
jgi:hypothetical protein